MLDIVSTLSLVFDIGWFTDAYFNSGDSGNTGQAANAAQLAKAGRASRVGTKAGRIVRIVRLIRLIRVVKLYKSYTQSMVENPDKFLEAMGEDGDDPTILPMPMKRQPLRKPDEAGKHKQDKGDKPHDGNKEKREEDD